MEKKDINTIKRDTGVTDDQLKEMVHEEDLFAISEEVDDYLAYAEKLGLKPAKRSEIRTSLRLNEVQKVRAVLNHWTANSANPTYLNLIQVALVLEDGNVASKLGEMCAGRFKSTSPQSLSGRTIDGSSHTASSSQPDEPGEAVAGCESCFKQTAQPKPTSQSQGAGAIAPGNKFWARNKLKVCFLNSIPKTWKFGGYNIRVSGNVDSHVINTTDILTLANKWNSDLPGSIPREHRECIPTFAPEDDPAKAQIRIWFTTQGGNRTIVGNEATQTPAGWEEKNATMWLNLGGVDDRHMEHLVMHEFGHALGLGHEHQRPDYWKILGKFLKKSVVESFFNSFTHFSVDGESYGDVAGKRSEYDANSIMHYWVDSKWLHEEYDTDDKVEWKYRAGAINSTEREYLLGFLSRRREKGLATKPSETDLKSVAKWYFETLRGGEGSKNEATSNIQAGPSMPNPAQIASNNASSVPVRRQDLRPTAPTIESLKVHTGVTDEQLDALVAKVDFDQLAKCFGAVKYNYLVQLGLDDDEIDDVEDKRTNQAKMVSALRLWQRKNVHEAKFRVLVEILLKDENGSGALRVCEYLTKP